MLKRKLSESGDTIVEVLISLALLSFILVGAYFAANNSLLQERRSSFRTQALQLAQGQIEMLKAYYTVNKTAPPSTPICLSLSGSNIVTNSVHNPVPSPYDPTLYSAACNVDNGGNPVGIHSGTPFYSLSVETMASPANSFKVQANYYSPGGGDSNVTLYYRVQ